MSSIAAIGNDHDLVGFALAGVDVKRATSDAQIDAAWEGLEPDVGLVILSPRAAERLSEALRQRPHLLSVVLP